MSRSWLSASNLNRSYDHGPNRVHAVRDLNLHIARGEFLSIVGASGSGKSTLLNLLAGLDTPSSGTIEVDGVMLGELEPRELARYRARLVGMVFQSFHLISHQTALQNVELALYFSDVGPTERRERALETLDRLGLSDRVDHRPAALSGGEQQRVAVARALVKEPEVLFADEPTGNLDRKNSEQIARILMESHARGLTIVLVTHDSEFAAKCSDRTVTMDYGRLVSENDSPRVRHDTA